MTRISDLFPKPMNNNFPNSSSEVHCSLYMLVHRSRGTIRILSTATSIENWKILFNVCKTMLTRFVCYGKRNMLIICLYELISRMLQGKMLRLYDVHITCDRCKDCEKFAFDK